MPRRLLVLAVLALAVVPAAALAQRTIRQDGNLRISFDGGLSPHDLPRNRQAPVALHVEGAISTTDGSHAPPLNRLVISLNGHGRLSTVGLPSCTSAELQSTTTADALARCRPALVGRGHFLADVSFSNLPPIPAGGRTLAFNGRLGGKRALLLHLYITNPVQTTFILPLTISQKANGQFGAVLSAAIPTLAGGLGSVSALDLTIGRNYTYRGRQYSYLSASCPAPAGFPGANFNLARGDFHFADGRTIKTVLGGDCKVR
jgi:hypothetical protein